MGEDRPAVAAQLVALAHLPADVHVVIAHDPAALADDLAGRSLPAGIHGRSLSSPASRRSIADPARQKLPKIRLVRTTRLLMSRLDGPSPLPATAKR